MVFSDLIKKRQSVRTFVDKPVEREKILMCLEAARLAPSASNAQPWKFIVVDDVQLKNRLCDAAFGGIYFSNSFCKQAPALIIVVSEQSKFLTKIGGWLRNTAYHLIDIGIAGEHLVLQASDIGLGTCWIGWFNERPIKSILNVPMHKKIDVLIAIGYYDSTKMPEGFDREPLGDIVSFNAYQPN